MSFKNFTFVGIVTSLSLSLLSQARPAHALSIQLGDQDFDNGQSVEGVIGFSLASEGEAAPFDSFGGNDLRQGQVFSENWTFNFDPGDYIGATLTLGIFDHDSQAPGSQVNSFGFDDNDLTSLLDEQFESFGGDQLEYNVYSIDLPETFLADLNNGSATFNLSLQAQGLGDDSLMPGNGAGLDFARLDLLTAPEPELESPPVPEPTFESPLVIEPELDSPPAVEPDLELPPAVEPDLETREIPEPSALLGTLVALGFGTLLKRKGSNEEKGS